MTSASQSRIATYTAQTSTQVRALALAAITVVWAFAGGFSDGAGETLKNLDGLKGNNELRMAIICAFAALAFDIAQYAWGSLTTAVFQWHSSTLLHPKDHHHLSWRRRIALRVSQASGFFRAVERAVITTPSTSWAQRRADLRAVIVNAHRGTPAPGTPEAALLHHLALDLLPLMRGVNLLFGLKVLALAGSYGFLLTYVIKV